MKQNNINYHRQYRPEIDGLRSIAVLAVVFYHAGFLEGGYIGVDIFFVISGYLITSIILKELSQQQFSLLKFYERRARRILPALFLVMLVSLFPAYYLMSPHQLKEFGLSLVSINLFVSNFLFWSEIGYFSQVASLKPLLHTWSLAIEEQFYIVFPVILLTLYKYNKKLIGPTILIACFISLIFSIHLSSTNDVSLQNVNFYFPFGRAWELGAGALTAYLMGYKQIGASNKTYSILGLIIIIYSFYVFNTGSFIFFDYFKYLQWGQILDKKIHHPGIHTLLPIIGTCLVIYHSNNKCFTGKILSIKLLVIIGLISYSLYLWHFSLFAYAKLYSIDEPSNNIYILLIIISIVLSYLTWKFIETPFRNKQQIKTKPLFITLATLSLLFIFVGLILHFSNGLYDHLKKSQAGIYIEASHSTPPLISECQNTKKTTYWDCIIGDRNTIPSILSIGDSHRLSLDFPLHKQLLSKKRAAYVNDSCSHLTNLINDPFCGDIINFIDSHPEIELVVMHYKYAKWEQISDKISIDKLNSLVAQLKSKNISVLIVYPVPVYKTNVPRTLFKLNKLNKDLTLPYVEHQDLQKKAIQTIDKITNSNVIKAYPDTIFCKSFVDNTCVTHNNDYIFYYDNGHLTVYGGDLVAEDLINKINIFFNK